MSGAVKCEAGHHRLEWIAECGNRLVEVTGLFRQITSRAKVDAASMDPAGWRDIRPS